MPTDIKGDSQAARHHPLEIFRFIVCNRVAQPLSFAIFPLPAVVAVPTLMRFFCAVNMGKYFLQKGMSRVRMALVTTKVVKAKK